MNLTDLNLILDRPLAVLDLESTGVDPAVDRIVEVAVLKLVPKGEHELYHRRIHPGVTIPASASRIHGISDHDVRHAPRFAAVAAELSWILAGADLAGFGITGFDLPLLVAEFGRVGVPFRVAGRRVIDALALYRRFHPRTLASAVREYLGREHEDAHSAVDDVLATADVLNEQVWRHGLPASPDELHDFLVDVDVGRRFRKDDAGHVVFGFGKYSGRLVSEVAARDRRYLEWMLSQPFLDDVHDLVRRALARV